MSRPHRVGALGRPLRGSAVLPADKSLLHRALILGAMAGGTSRIIATSGGADTASTAECLRALGVRIERDRADIRVMGTGWRVPGEAILDAGNSGTTIRLLTGALAGRTGSFRLLGDESLSRRPMGRIAEPLRLMGAEIGLAEGDTPPVVVRGGGLQPVRYELPVASAQVKSCILLAGLQASGRTVITEPFPTRDHTERMLQSLGCEISTGVEIALVGGEQLFEHEGFEFEVPGDISSASFLLVAALLIPGSEVTLRRVGLNPGRTGLLEVLRIMGADIEWDERPGNEDRDLREPVGTIRAGFSRLGGTEVGPEMVPRCVDELPLVALAATQAEGETLISGAGDLRNKEADRIAVLCSGLRTLGADVEPLEGGLRVTGPTPLGGGRVDSHGDHRMALTFAVAGLLAAEPVEIDGWEAIRISYPEFEGQLAGLLR